MNESSSIEVYRQSSLEDRKAFALTIADSGDLLPIGYRNKDGSANAAKVLVAFELAESLGMKPVPALWEIYVVEGRPSLSARAMGALVRSAGHRVRIFSRGSMATRDFEAVCQITRSDDPEFTYESVWTMERAERAQLTGKSNWNKTPEQMLTARSIGECSRQAAPEALMGLAYTREEVQDMEPARIIEAAENPQAAPILDPELAPKADENGEVIEDAEVVEEPVVYVRPKQLEAILVEAETAINPPNIEAWRAAYRKAKRGGYLQHPIPPDETVDSYLTNIGQQINELLDTRGPDAEPNEDPADPA